MNRVRLQYSLKALGGTMGAQWERDRRDALFLMGAILLATMPHFGHLPWWVSVGFLFLFIWRLGLVLSGRWLPRDSIRWIAAFACLAGVYAEYKTLTGRDAGVALLVLFLGLKLMEMRVKRDLFVVIFLCFFLLLTAFFYSQSILTAIITIAALVALLAAMLTMQFGENEVSVGRRLRTVGNLLLQALPIAAVLFVLFPRMQSPLWGLPRDAFAGKTGLSDRMQPGSISELNLSDEIAFRVRYQDGASPPPPGSLYWRGPVFGLFDGQVWRIAQATPDAMPPPLQVTAEPGSRPLGYTVTLEPTEQPWLAALEAPVALDDDTAATARLQPDMTLVDRAPVVTRIRYSVTSHLDYRIGANETPQSLRPWLELPVGYNPRTIALAERWRSEGAHGPGAMVDRALSMFRKDSFRYTLTPPTLGVHGVDEFLFDTRSGFCEHYSGAFVVLMRALGIPARVVTGYQGAERNPVDDYWIVRQSDAHAWAEVWFADRGWQRIDPTNAVAPERIERGRRATRPVESLIGGLGEHPLLDKVRFNMDALANAWNQWVLSYDKNRQQRLLDVMGISLDDWREVAGALALSLGLLIGAAALITLHPRLPRDPIERAYADFCDRLAAAVGLHRMPHETPARYLSRVERLLEASQVNDARRIVADYSRLRYEQDAAVADDVRHFSAMVKAFKP